MVELETMEWINGAQWNGMECGVRPSMNCALAAGGEAAGTKTTAARSWLMLMKLPAGQPRCRSG